MGPEGRIRRAVLDEALAPGEEGVGAVLDLRPPGAGGTRYLARKRLTDPKAALPKQDLEPAVMPAPGLSSRRLRNSCPGPAPAADPPTGSDPRARWLPPFQTWAR